MKRRLLELGVLVGALAVLGALVVVSGIMPIRASDGHWPTTVWFLEFSMSRSVATHSSTIEAPPLDDPDLVVRGAGMYRTSCRPCHGDPTLPHPRVAAAMTPAPPYLPPRVDNWSREELFYITKHGILFTGMPAWPAQVRDDEVWAVVAFLEAMPGLDEAAYRELALGETPGLDEPAMALEAPSTSAPPAIVTLRCVRCHGADGTGRAGAFPALAGQSAEYLERSLLAYAAGERPSGAMEPVAADLSSEELRVVVDYYAGLDPPQRIPIDDDEVFDEQAIERGREIAANGVPSQKVPSCEDCHGEFRDPEYPSLAGQDFDYLRMQLELFRRHVRGGADTAELMDPVADGLTPEQMDDVAAYFATLGE